MTIEMFDADGLGRPPSAPPPKRNRNREGAIKSENSHIKHGLFRQVTDGQVAAFLSFLNRLRGKRALLIDGNGGDGVGVEKLQRDLLDPDLDLSMTTPALLLRWKQRSNLVDVLICEKNKAHRENLTRLFPDATIIGDHAEAVNYVRSEHGYALWESDPCGPKDHGVEAMRAIAERIPASDFVIAFNDGATKRIEGTSSHLWSKARDLYTPMRAPIWWADQLGRSHVACTPLQEGSNNFRYRVLVVSNYLSSAAKRKPFEVIR